MLKLIGLAGVDGSAGMGKDTLASKYLKPAGILTTALADEIKIRVVASGQATYEEAFFTKPDHVRKLLQEEGTERGRDLFGEDYWCNILHSKLRNMYERNGLASWAITDVRFPNEVAFIHRHGGIVIGIDAPKRYAANGMSAKNREHKSERALDGQSHLFDYIVQNDPEHEAVVGQQIAHILLLGNRVYEPVREQSVRLGVRPEDLPGA